MVTRQAGSSEFKLVPPNTRVDPIKPPKQSNEATTNSTPRATLFLVEDSATQAAQFQVHFKNLGYRVITAASSKMAEEKLNELIKASTNAPCQDEWGFDTSKPNIIVLDYLLQGEDSLELCRQLKADEQLRGATVLVYSAENKLAFMTSAYEAGADYYVVKGKEGLLTLEMLIDSVITRQKRQLRRMQAR